MAPYYEQDGITIYHGDCREIAPKLSQIDLILSDPPYGISYQHSGGICGIKAAVGITKSANARVDTAIIGDDKPFDPSPWTEFPNVILWGADHFFPRLPDRGRWLAWNKLAEMEPWDNFCDVEFAWHSLEGAARIFSMLWKGLACDKRGENNGLRWHPTQKPIRLMRWCIEQSKIKVGDVVVDPFMGVGTTIVAAREAGMRAIGIEIEERYCKIAANRLAQGVLFGVQS